MGVGGTPCTNFGIRAPECCDFPEIISLASHHSVFVRRCTAVSEASFVPQRITKSNMTTTTTSNCCKALITSIDRGRVSNERRVSVDGDSRISYEIHSPSRTGSGKRELNYPCNDNDGIFVITVFLIGGSASLQEVNDIFESKKHTR